MLSKDVGNLSFEEKLMILDLIDLRVDYLIKQIKKERVESGNCPHEHLINSTTLGDPIDVRKKTCLDCGKELIFRGGILQNE